MIRLTSIAVLALLVSGCSGPSVEEVDTTAATAVKTLVIS